MSCCFYFRYNFVFVDEKILSKLWKIATKKNFSSQLFLEVQWGQPLNLTKIFPDKETFFLELGSGWGEVAIQLAIQKPKTGFILLEKKPDRLKETFRKIQKRNLTNIRFLNANFNWFLEEFFEPNSFHEILLNFPDPWPKNKHHKHRTFNEEFPKKLFYLLKSGGLFYFASDHGGYARSVIRNLRRNSKFFEKISYSFQRENFPISHYEQKKLNEKKCIYYVEAQKSIL